MAYENEHLNDRQRHDAYRRYEESGYAPWLVLAAVVVGLVALIWMFGGTPANDPGLAPRIDSSVPAPQVTPEPAAPVIPGAETAPAPVLPVD